MEGRRQYLTVIPDLKLGKAVSLSFPNSEPLLTYLCMSFQNTDH